MNLVLAVLLYGLLAGMGSQVPEMETSGRIGLVAPDSAAASAPLFLERPGAALATYGGDPDATGWRTGDVILEIDGKPVEKFADIALSALLGGAGRTYHVVLERENDTGGFTRFVSPIVPLVKDGDEHPRFGVLPFETPVVAGILDDMPAQAAGLLTGDEILRLNGAPVDRATFLKSIEDTSEGATVTIGIERNGALQSIELQPRTIGRLRDVVCGLDGEDVEAGNREPAVVLAISEEARAKTGLQRKDRIVEVDGSPVTAQEFDEFVRRNPGKEVKIGVERPQILFGLLQEAETRALTLSIDPVRAVGIEMTSKLVSKVVPASRIVPEAFRQSYEALELVMQTLHALIMRTVSPRNLGGPLMIAGAASQAAEEGLYWLVRITAFISINLCVFNLLPLPVLDGGIILLQAIEALRRRPLSLRFQERFQMAGLFLILFLMIFVTYHDVRRWIEGLIP